MAPRTLLIGLFGILLGGLQAPAGAAQDGPDEGEEEACEVGVTNQCIVQRYGSTTYCSLGEALEATGVDDGRVSALIAIVPGLDDCFSNSAFAYVVVWFEYV